VHRGCSRRHIRGLGWTTDEHVADGFACGHRGIPVHDPGIASGLVSKRDIFFVAVERNESEVVLDPVRFSRLSWRKAGGWFLEAARCDRPTVTSRVTQPTPISDPTMPS
jgi:hypothetical protein